MATPNRPKKLPRDPSVEHLRKQAKRLARQDPSLQLADAQHRVAQGYGFPSWIKLVKHVESVRRGSGAWHTDPNDNLPKAANAGDVAKVRDLLMAGRFTQHDLDLALGRVVCGMGRYSERDRWAMAEMLIAAGADPDGEYGGNYGHIVFGPCEGIDYDGIKYLIDHGADVSFAPIDTKYGKQTPLSLLLGTYQRGKNEEKHRAIDLLLTHGAVVPPDVRPEVLAIHRGDVKTLADLLDQDHSLIHRRFAEMPYGNIALGGATLLHCAVEFGEIECCEELLNRYADINAKADMIDGLGGQTPIFHAIATNQDHNFYTLEYLAKRVGQHIDMTAKATWRSYGEPQGTPMTPLEYAEVSAKSDQSWRRSTEQELAIIRGLNRNAQLIDAVRREDVVTVTRHLDECPRLLTPSLWPAAIFQAKSLTMTRLLLDRGLTPDECSAPRKPLHLAADRGLVEVVRLLLERGAATEVVDGENVTPLELVAMSRFPNGDQSLALLRAAGARESIFTAIALGDEAQAIELLDRDPSLVSARGPVWFTPLDLASRFGREAVVSRLLSLGTPVDAANPAHNTALWLACQSSEDAAGRIAVARRLLNAGADPNRRCADGSTPLHFAAWRGPVEMVELLLSRGGDASAKDDKGVTPGDYARGSKVSGQAETIVAALERSLF